MRMNESSGERLLINPTEAARVLCMSPRKLWQLTQEKKIPSVRIDRNWRYSPEALRRWVEEAGGAN